MPINLLLNITTSSTQNGQSRPRASNFLSDVLSISNRRNAKVVPYKLIKGHKFEQSLMTEFTFCSQCCNFIWGLYCKKCRMCKLVCHQKCLDSMDTCCSESGLVSDPPSHNAKCHDFNPTFFMKPTFCDNCGTLIKGIWYRQGLKCRSCQMCSHYECKESFRNRKCENSGRSAMRTTPSDEDLKPKRLASKRDWSKVKISDFELIRFLDKGSFSKVYLAKFSNSSDSKVFAIKVVKKTQTEVCGDPSGAIMEREALKFGRTHRFLTGIHCCFQSESRLFYVMDYVAGKNLLYYLEARRKFREDWTRFYAAELVLALMYLHRHQVVYRDLKLEHIIIDQHGHCKLIDFGMSKTLGNEMRTRTFCGSENYISPEMIRVHQGLEYHYGLSVDWWALGVVMYEMLVGCSPFPNDLSQDELFQRIEKAQIIYPESSFLSDKSRQILQGFLTKDPSKRLGCSPQDDSELAILFHSFFLPGPSDYALFQGPIWEAIMENRLKPPFKPSEFELEPPEFDISRPLCSTPIACTELWKVPQSEFNNFSYYSDSFEAPGRSI